MGFLSNLFGNPNTYTTNKGYERYKDSGRYVHRAAMEKELGRKLRPKEVVHHKKGKTDNSPENLKLYRNQSEHMRKEHSKKKNKGFWDIF